MKFEIWATHYVRSCGIIETNNGKNALRLFIKECAKKLGWCTPWQYNYMLRKNSEKIWALYDYSPREECFITEFIARPIKEEN